MGCESRIGWKLVCLLSLRAVFWRPKFFEFASIRNRVSVVLRVAFSHTFVEHIDIASDKLVSTAELCLHCIHRIDWQCYAISAYQRSEFIALCVRVLVAHLLAVLQFTTFSELISAVSLFLLIYSTQPIMWSFCR